MTLSLVAQKMKKNNVLIKKMSIIETLGSTTVIASDKTGTITMNKMTLSHISMYSVHDENLLGLKVEDLNDNYKTLLTMAGLCNKAIVEEDEARGMKQFIGSPTECAILKAVCHYVDISKKRNENPIEFEIPFNSRYKYHLSVHKLTSISTLPKELKLEVIGNKTHLCVIKGAPEVIAELCTFGFNVNKIDSFKHTKEFFLDKAHNLAGIGERVLGIAYTFIEIPKFDSKVDEMFSENSLPNDFCFYGLVSLIDPPRMGVADAVTKCHNGFIKVMMVTGKLNR